MTKEENLRRRKRIEIAEEFFNMLFEHPDNYYVKSGIPDNANFYRVYEDPPYNCIVVEYQCDDWEKVGEGNQIPELEIEFRELLCQRCDSKMMYDEKNKSQYCPRCERRFYCEN
jgi:hypothetical protein